MSVIDEDEKPTPAKPSSSRTKTRRSGSRPKRTKTAPNRVDPGWTHRALAEFTLKTARDRLAIDVGELPNKSETDAVADNAAPVETLARIFAHIGHRLPFVKRFEKRLEGQDKTAGIGSDLMALLSQLARRNQPVVEGMIDESLRSIKAQQAAKAAKAKADTPVSAERQES